MPGYVSCSPSRGEGPPRELLQRLTHVETTLSQLRTAVDSLGAQVQQIKESLQGQQTTLERLSNKHESLQAQVNSNETALSDVATQQAHFRFPTPRASTPPLDPGEGLLLQPVIAGRKRLRKPAHVTVPIPDQPFMAPTGVDRKYVGWNGVTVSASELAGL